MQHTRTSIIFLLVLALGALTACDGPSENAPLPDPDAEPQTLPEADSGPYRMNLEGVETPTQPVAGEVGGEAFTLDKAVYNISSGSLRLVGEGGQEIILFVLLDDEAKPEGASVTIETPEFSVGDANLHVTYIQNNQPVTQMVTTGFVLKLAFEDDRVLPDPEPDANAQDRDAQEPDAAVTTPEPVLPGRVYVCLPDAYQSYVAGEFQAQVRP